MPPGTQDDLGRTLRASSILCSTCHHAGAAYGRATFYKPCRARPRTIGGRWSVAGVRGFRYLALVGIVLVGTLRQGTATHASEVRHSVCYGEASLPYAICLQNSVSRIVRYSGNIQLISSSYNQAEAILMMLGVLLDSVIYTACGTNTSNVAAFIFDTPIFFY